MPKTVTTTPEKENSAIETEIQETSIETDTCKEDTKKQKKKKRKYRLGDRHDGYRVRDLDLPFMIIPNIMRTRVDSQVFFNIPIDIEVLEKYVRQKRRDGIPDIRLMHVFIAALVRMFATRPRVNRFVSGKKIYAHKDISFSMSVKRSLTDNGEETEICPVFEPTDTIYEITEKFNNAWKEVLVKEDGKDHGTDKLNRIVGVVPTFLKTFIVFALRNLDKVGLMPKIVTKLSPFHASAYVTDVGSLGIDSIYHHLYEFGTCSCFMAIGKKQYVPFVKDDGTLGEKKVINLRFVLDERICDGHYYANSLKAFRRLLKHPELLELPPENIPDEI